MDEKMGGQWGAETSTDFTFWAILFYGLAALAALASFILLFILPSSDWLRRRHLTVFLWSMAFWHVLNAVFHTPWFQGVFDGLGDVPRGHPWLCPIAAVTMDIAFNVEVVSVFALAIAYIATLNRARRSGRAVGDIDWSSRTKWAVLLFVWLWSILSSLPWSLPRLPTPINGTSPTEYKCKVPMVHRYWYDWYSNIIAFGLAGTLTITALVLCIVAAVKGLRGRTNAQVDPEAKGDIKLLLLIIIKFGLAWLPVWILFLIRVFGGSVDKEWRYFKLVILLIKWLHEHTGLWNFLLIPLLMPAGRDAFRRFFTCQCSRHSSIHPRTKSPLPVASPFYRS